MKKEKISFIIGLFIAFMITTGLSSCQKSLEERAKEEARNFTERLCPTPVVNFSRTDSMTFDSSTKTFVNHCTLIIRNSSMTTSRSFTMSLRKR